MNIAPKAVFIKTATINASTDVNSNYELHVIFAESFKKDKDMPTI